MTTCTANSNAAKHGFYRSVFREDEYAGLLKYAEQFDLTDEFGVARVHLRSGIEYVDQ